VLAAGRLGETYNIGGKSEMRNLEVVHAVCAVLDELRPKAQGRYAEQIRFVTTARPRPPLRDRPAQDRGRTGLAAGTELRAGIRLTVQWYLDNAAWTERVRSGGYRD